MNELEEFCKALKKGLFKSKQKAFNIFKNDIIKAVDLYGWNKVILFINNETGVHLNINTYKSMLARANKAQSSESKIRGSTSERTSSLASKTDNKTKINEKNDDRSYSEQDLKAYLKVCFNSEPIAKRAIDSGVSIELIKSWNCPNQIRLGTTLSNYSMNK